jgi:hypothetical protein
MALAHESLQVGVVGAALQVAVEEWDNTLLQDVPVDISQAVTKEIIVQRPDGTTFTRSAVNTTNGTDGLMFIATIAGDITLEGTYYLQGRIAFSGWDGKSTIGEFEVHDNLG